jgi:hypothetical protein
MAINNCTPFIKIRLRIENKTRWSSTFSMLESFHKACLRNVFSNEPSCPVSYEVIEIYLQILLPAFQFNLVMKKTKSISASKIIYYAFKMEQNGGDW